MAIHKSASLMARCSPEKLEQVKEFAASKNMTMAELINLAVDKFMREDAIDVSKTLKEYERRLAKIEEKICA